MGVREWPFEPDRRERRDDLGLVRVVVYVGFFGVAILDLTYCLVFWTAIVGVPWAYRIGRGHS